MATATPTHGSKGTLLFNAVNVTDHMQGDFAMEAEYPTVDTTVFGASATTHIPSPIADNKPTQVQLLFDATTHNAIRVLNGVAGTTWTYSPIGTTTGNPQQTGSGTITNYKVSGGLTSPAMINFTYTPSGAGTWGTAP